ncbi:MAG: sensor histidine kinase [Candidatus Competibacteraceae bacterium]|jgi:signal transduction histidine kinase|nr:sensor histidine kinase [Candidatus Competibacteraceae bacterium]
MRGPEEYKILFEQAPVSINEIEQNGHLLTMNGTKLDATGALEEHVGPEKRLQAARFTERAFEGNAAEFKQNLAFGIQTMRERASEAQRIRQLREKVEKEERERIAAHLHDLVGQSLQSVNLGLKRLRALEAKDGQLARELLNDLISDVGMAIGDLRDIGKELRPIFLERMNLHDAVRFHCRDISKRTGIEIRFLANDVPITLQERVKEQCFLSFREALANALKHARAKQIDVSLHPPSTTELPLTIKDDGVGFDPQNAHQRPSGLGLAMIHERVTSVGGRATIRSQPGKGTSVEISVPLANEVTV